MTASINYYEILEISEKATTEEIKQSYKKLALEVTQKHHPDKNEDKEKAKVMFTQISEAYTVLTDPEKRGYYDKYGTADVDGMDFDFNFESFFAASFEDFESFLNEALFDSLGFGMDKMFFKLGKGGSKNQKKSKRAKGTTNGLNNDLNKLLSSMMGLGGQLFEDEKPKQKKSKQDKSEQDDEWETDSEDEQNAKDKDDAWEDESEDDDDIPDEMELMMLPVFIQEQSTTTKKNKKKTMVCKIDSETFKTNQELVDHFCQSHMKEFKKWMQTR